MPRAEIHLQFGNSCPCRLCIIYDDDDYNVMAIYHIDYCRGVMHGEVKGTAEI